MPVKAYWVWLESYNGNVCEALVVTSSIMHAFDGFQLPLCIDSLSFQCSVCSCPTPAPATFRKHIPIYQNLKPIRVKPKSSESVTSLRKCIGISMVAPWIININATLHLFSQAIDTLDWIFSIINVNKNKFSTMFW